MAARYFVGNGTNWSSTASWATTSGGASGAAVPTAADDVHLDVNSPGNLTLDANASCLTLDCTGFTHTLAHNVSVSLTVAGSLFKLVAGMTYTVGGVASSTLLFTQSTAGTVAITTAGFSVGGTNFGAGLSSSSAIYQLQDSLTTAGTITLVCGTLDTNGKTCNWTQLSSNNANTRTLTLGASNITITGVGSNWIGGFGGSMTVNAGTSTITFTGLSAGPQFGNTGPYNNLIFTGGGNMAPSNTTTTLTCNNLTITGTSVKTDNIILRNVVVNGTLTINGNSATNRMLVQSFTLGTAFTLTAVGFGGGNVDFMDITGAGTAAPFTGTSLGDCGGNSGITFTSSTTQTWSGNSTGNWSDVTKWTSRVPLPQDDVLINGLTSGVITIDMPRASHSLTCAGSTGGTLNFSAGPTFFGDFTLAAGMNISPSQPFNLQGRGPQTLTTNGVTLPFSTGGRLTIFNPGGTYSLGGDLTLTGSNTSALNLGGGTFDANGHNVTASNVSLGIGGAGGTFKLGTGTWTITSSDPSGSPVWRVGGGTIQASSSTIVLSDASATAKTFAGNGATYNNVMITGGGTGAVLFNGANTINLLTIGAPKTVTFTSGTTQTINKLQIYSSSGNLVTLNSSTPGAAATLSVPNQVAADYISVQDITAAGTTPFYAGVGSTLVSNDTNWTQAHYDPPQTVPTMIGMVGTRVSQPGDMEVGAFRNFIIPDALEAFVQNAGPVNAQALVVPAQPQLVATVAAEDAVVIRE